MKFKIVKSAILFAIITSCSKDPGPCGGQKTYYYLSEKDKAKVPYTGTDTLVFVSNTNDTAVCVGQGKKQFFTVEYDSGNPDCEPAEYYYEAYNYKYDCLNTNFKLDLNIFKKFAVNQKLLVQLSTPNIFLFTAAGFMIILTLLI
jgi:hypothetical protein